MPGLEANLLQLHQDLPNQWDAWDVDRFYRNSVTDLREVDAIARARTGGLVIERSFSKSTIRQTLSLEPGERTLLVEFEADWQETEKFLKVAFPFAIHAEHTAAETQFGYYQRVTHTNTSWEAAKFETAMHRYVHTAEPEFGATLITDSTYGYDVTRDSDPDLGVTTTVRLSLLRAPRFPDPATDQGRQTLAYGLLVGSTMTDAVQAGIALNAAERVVRGGHPVDPLVAVVGRRHRDLQRQAGRRPQRRPGRPGLRIPGQADHRDAGDRRGRTRRPRPPCWRSRSARHQPGSITIGRGSTSP